MADKKPLLPTDKGSEIKAPKMAAFGAQLYSGPIPPASELAALNQIQPDLVDRVVKIAEIEQAERHLNTSRIREMELLALRLDSRDSALGIILGCMLGMTATILGTVAVCFGHEWAGGFIGTSGITGLVVGFVRESRRRRANGIENDK